MQILDLYKIIEITPYIGKSQLIFQISIPLFKLGKFRIHKIISVPSVHRNELWQIINIHDYVISGINRQSFQFMSENELSECLDYQVDVIVCSMQSTIFCQVSNNCVWNIFNQFSNQNCNVTRSNLENVFVELAGNKWIFVIPNTSKLTIVCDSLAFNDELQGEGILELNANCMIRNEHVQLDAHMVINGKPNEIVIPRINHIALLE